MHIKGLISIAHYQDPQTSQDTGRARLIRSLSSARIPKLLKQHGNIPVVFMSMYKNSSFQ